MEEMILKDASVFTFIGMVASYPTQAKADVEDYIGKQRMSDDAAAALRENTEKNIIFSRALLPLVMEAFEIAQSATRTSTQIGQTTLSSAQLEKAMHKALLAISPDAHTLVETIRPDVSFDNPALGADFMNENIFPGHWLEGIQVTPQQRKSFNEALHSMHEMYEIFRNIHRQQTVARFSDSSLPQRIM